MVYSPHRPTSGWRNLSTSWRMGRETSGGAGRFQASRAPGQLGETVGQPGQLPFLRERGGFRPGRRLVAERRQRRRGVHRRDAAIGPQRFGLGREAALGQRLLEAAVLPQQARGALRTDAPRARQLVGRIAAQGDEIRDLPRLDAEALADLGGAVSAHPAGPDRLPYGRPPDASWNVSRSPLATTAVPPRASSAA